MYNTLTFPMANRPLSNNSNMPKKTNAIPNPARPTPISILKRADKKNVWNSLAFINCLKCINGTHFVYLLFPTLF